MLLYKPKKIFCKHLFIYIHRQTKPVMQYSDVLILPHLIIYDVKVSCILSIPPHTFFMAFISFFCLSMFCPQFNFFYIDIFWNSVESIWCHILPYSGCSPFFAFNECCIEWNEWRNRRRNKNESGINENEWGKSIIDILRLNWHTDSFSFGKFLSFVLLPIFWFFFSNRTADGMLLR